MVDASQRPVEIPFLQGGGGVGALIADYDWASTPLGALDAWPQSLKTATAMVLHSPVAMLLLWGSDGVMIYNDAYAAMIGRKHPHVLGSRRLESAGELAGLSAQILETGLAGEKLTLGDKELTIDRSGRPEQVWLNLDCSPVRDESGAPAGVLVICVETTARVLKEREAAAYAARQRRMFEQAPGFIALLNGPTHVFEFANEAYKRQIEKQNVVGRTVRDVFADYPLTGFHAVFDEVYATGQRFVARELRKPMRTANGLEEERFTELVLEPLTDERGQVTGIFIEGFDVTERVRARAASEETARRLTAAIAVARLGVFEWDAETKTAILDARAREIFGFAPDERLTTDDVTARIDGDDRSRISSENEVALCAGRTQRRFEFRIHRPDGEVRDVVCVAEALRAPDGAVGRTFGLVDDVTDRRRAEQRQQLLINELNHRVKNTLATVQSIAAQTLRSATNLTVAREAFETRLVALAAAHDLLTSQSWRGAPLAQVVAIAMAPFETTQRPQINRSGPPVWLTAPRALALSLALHELATNAAKYGALSVPQGRVTIRWSKSAGGELTLSWIEEGGPPVTAPVREGFGTRLLERSLARELGGDVSFTFAREGVRCVVRCGLEEGDHQAVRGEDRE